LFPAAAPGPVVLVNAFHADMGKTLMYGIIIAIPTVIIAGPFLGRILKRIQVNSFDLFGDSKTVQTKLPSAIASFSIALLPVLLITFRYHQPAIADKANIFRQVISFIGDSTIALL
jgi:Gnt-I system high-affinity gluconate transporter